jgi:hypothetical protein
LTETKEMVFPHPGPCRFIALPSLVDIERVTTFKLRGVYNASTMETQFNCILSLVHQWLYLINKLRKAGLSAKAREVVFHSLITSHLLCCSLAFAGF